MRRLTLVFLAKHLILGTHGRSLYKATIASLQLMTSKVMAKEAHIFPISTIKKIDHGGIHGGDGQRHLFQKFQFHIT